MPACQSIPPRANDWVVPPADAVQTPPVEALQVDDAPAPRGANEAGAAAAEPPVLSGAPGVIIERIGPHARVPDAADEAGEPPPDQALPPQARPFEFSRDMPVDVTRTVASFLPVKGLGSIPGFASVDKAHHRLHLLNEAEAVQPPDILTLRGFTANGGGELRKLYLTMFRDKRFTPADMAQVVRKCPKLESVDLSRSGVRNEHLSHLSSLAHLEHLDLGHTMINDRALAHLQTLPLKTLSLQNCPLLTAEGLAHLSHMQIEELNLGLFHLTDAGLQCISSLPLKRLTVGMDDSVTVEGWSKLTIPTLEELDLSWSKITDEGLKAVLPLLPALKVLNLNYCERLTDDGLRSVPSGVRIENRRF